MCLSIVYKDKLDEKNILMKNVMRIESNHDSLVLTDLMERKMKVKGTLNQANLVDGYVIVHVDEDSL
jgi:predicted RNA-binding protein